MDLKDYEERFLLDYVWFGNSVLGIEAKALEDAHHRTTDNDTRRALLIALHTILLQQCERVAAWLLAFKRRAESGTSVVETILRYGPGDAVLAEVMDGVTSGDALLSMCGIDPSRQSVSDADIRKRADSLFEGLAHYATEQKTRSPLYNKSKHGMVFYSSLTILNPSEPDGGPVAMFATSRKADPISPTYVGILDSDDQPMMIRDQIVRLGHAIGDLIAMHLQQEHAGSRAKLAELIRAKESFMMLDSSNGAPRYE